MSNEMTDITNKLQEYDEAFDFYMDRGQLPESIPQGDLLGDFISQTIQDNPQLESQDPIWVEILKDELMKFIEAMLKLFQPIEIHLVPSVLEYQRVIDRDSPHTLDVQAEVVIYWRLDDNFVSRLCESEISLVDARDDSRSVAYPFPVKIKAMITLLPSMDNIIKLRRDGSVT